PQDINRAGIRENLVDDSVWAKDHFTDSQVINFRNCSSSLWKSSDRQCAIDKFIAERTRTFRIVTSNVGNNTAYEGRLRVDCIGRMVRRPSDRGSASQSFSDRLEIAVLR